MRVNRYDKPVQSEYISQYTPIPFEQLYNLGKYYNEQVDKAYNDLSTQLAKWSEFRSPSAVDTKKWYDLTVGGAQNIVNQLAANPDLIKTQEGRSMISSYINSRPYDLLSRVRETAENAEMRNKMVAEMKAKGLYADWMDDPRMTPEGITNWDTELSGVMNDLAPVQFKDLRTIGLPYVEKLKPKYYKDVDPITGTKKLFTDWQAITEGDVQNALLESLGDITSTPQGQAWYNHIAQQVKAVNPNASQEEVASAFIDALTGAQADKIASVPVVDQVALEMWKQNQATLRAGIKKGAGGMDPNGLPFGFTSLSSGVVSKALSGKINAALERNPEAVIAANKNTSDAAASMLSAYDDIIKLAPGSDFAKAYNQLLSTVNKDPEFKKLNEQERSIAIAKGAIDLQRQFNGAISTDKAAMDYLNATQQAFTQQLVNSSKLGGELFIKDVAENEANQLEASIGSNVGGNAFSRFKLEFDGAGNPVAKDNALKKIIDAIYDNYMTPLQGAPKTLVEKEVLSDIVGKPLDVSVALTPAQFLDSSPEFNSYWQAGMRKVAEKQYANYEGSDKQGKIDAAVNSRAGDLKYDRQGWFLWSSDYKNDMNLEKAVKNGKLPAPTVTGIKGYVDTSNGGRAYDVEVELPFDVLDAEDIGLGRRVYPDFGAVRNKLKGFGYKPVTKLENGEQKLYFTFHMTLPVTNDNMQKYYSDIAVSHKQQPAAIQKEITGFNDTMLRLNTFSPATGWVNTGE